LIRLTGDARDYLPFSTRAWNCKEELYRVLDFLDAERRQHGLKTRVTGGSIQSGTFHNVYQIVE